VAAPYLFFLVEEENWCKRQNTNIIASKKEDSMNDILIFWNAAPLFQWDLFMKIENGMLKVKPSLGVKA